MGTLLIIFRSILLRKKNVSDKSCGENQNTLYSFDNYFPKIGQFMRYVGKHDTVTQATDGNTVLRRKDAIWMTDNQDKNTDANSLILNNNCFSIAAMVTRARLNVIRTITSLAV